MNDQVKNNNQTQTGNVGQGVDNKVVKNPAANGTKSHSAKKAQQDIVDEQQAKAAAEQKAAEDAKKAKAAAEQKAAEDAKKAEDEQAAVEAEALKSGGAIIRSRLPYSFTLADGTVVPPMVGDKPGATTVKDGKACANHNTVKQLVKNGVFSIESSNKEE